MQLYKDSKVSDQDRSTVEISIPGSKLHWLVRLTDKDATLIDGPKWKFEIKVDASSHLIVTIPAATFKAANLRSGQKINLEAKIVSECGAYTTRWHVARTLS